MLLNIFSCKNTVADNGNIGKIQGVLFCKLPNTLKHLSVVNRKGHYYDEIVVFFRDLGVFKHTFSPERVTSDKFVACKNIGNAYTECFKSVDYHIRTVAHSVNYDRKFCFL